MLVVRAEQMEALTLQMKTTFRDNAATRLRAQAPELLQDTSQEVLLAHVQVGIEQARSWQCVLHDDIHRFLELTLLFDWQLQKEPWALRILENRLLDGSSRIKQLEEHPAVQLRRKSR